MLKRSGREMFCRVVVDQFQEVFAVTIAASGREHRDVRDAEVFSWNELPELLAAEDLFEICGTAGEPTAVLAPVSPSIILATEWSLPADVTSAADEDDDFDDEEDEDEDDEDEDEDEEDEEEDEEWEEVEDEDDEEEDEEEEDEEEEEDDEEEDEEDEDWEDEDDDWEDDDEEDDDEDEDEEEEDKDED
jgi:hypothetical protein